MSATAQPDLATLFALYPVFAAVPRTLAERCFARGQVLRVPGGTVLFDEHNPCRGFPLVLEGSIRVAKAAPNGRELPLYRVGPGETCIITSSCLLARADYSARGVAEIETALMMLTRECFAALLDQPPFRDFLFTLFAERVAGLMQLVEEVAFRKLDQRLAALLLGKGRMVRTTHQHLADELGSVREIVSRLLKGFADDGLVALGREQVEILDPAGLRRIAAAGR
ncbi:MAG TPA: transcriptional regulator [Rhodocyclaceae bacterium]|nr:MAG: transcriptional regulator [Betaproteobacteria bacterium CG2_30_68_42]PIX75125.1 MAG: transcriptional regulator [Rhodocyclales bacterium CG_4_10_14_3_um_filter_68_10]PJA56950.1 MAG: transcriptional regulator [Rhodocyclales bacterium CG_4_9_14_3_um_filter_68_10]HCX33249.1 transcriptional regulator [Rhodocyclaceae bacterium]